MSDAFRPDPSLACDACGGFGAYAFEDEALCGECYTGRGACCSAEFSGTAYRTVRCAPAEAAPDGPSGDAERA